MGLSIFCCSAADKLGESYSLEKMGCEGKAHHAGSHRGSRNKASEKRALHRSGLWMMPVDLGWILC